MSFLIKQDFATLHEVIMRKIIPILSLIFLGFCFIPSYGQSVQEGITALLKGVGGKTKWDSTNFILFTVNGNKTTYLQDGRTFLIDKRSGKSRFEGTTNGGENLIVLFNFKTEKLHKYYKNGKEVVPLMSEANDSFGKILGQFRKDASLLFLPILLDKPDTKIGKTSTKIVNAEKLQLFSFQLPDNGLSGDILFNPETGLVKQVVDKDSNTYFVNGYKDIGGGLFLPTTFKNMSDVGKSTVFSTVAAFTDMEESKLNSL